MNKKTEAIISLRCKSILEMLNINKVAIESKSFSTYEIILWYNNGKSAKTTNIKKKDMKECFSSIYDVVYHSLISFAFSKASRDKKLLDYLRGFNETIIDAEYRRSLYNNLILYKSWLTCEDVHKHNINIMDLTDKPIQCLNYIDNTLDTLRMYCSKDLRAFI